MNRQFLGVLILLVSAGCAGDDVPDAPSAPDVAPAPQPGPAEPAATGQIERPIETVDPAELETVHGYTELFYRGELTRLFEHFSPEMKETLPLELLIMMHGQVRDNFGEEIEVLGEEAAVNGDYRAFVRWTRYDRYEGIMEVQWVLRPDDSIAGFIVRPAQRRTESPRNPSD